jgi:hypothetical protein
MAQDKQITLTEAELEAHLNKFLADGAGMADLEEELERLGLYDPEATDGKTLFLADEDVEPESDRAYWNIRDQAAKRGQDPQELAEALLRRRKEWWKGVERATKVHGRQKRQLDAWLAGEKGPYERFSVFCEFVLREYAEDFRKGEGTVKLIAGELQTRKCSDRIEWDKDAAVLEVVKRIRALPAKATDAQLLEAAKVLFVGSPEGYKASALKADLKPQCRKFVDAKGDVVPYVQKVPPAEAYSFKVVQAGVGGKVDDDGNDGGDES